MRQLRRLAERHRLLVSLLAEREALLQELSSPPSESPTPTWAETLLSPEPPLPPPLTPEEIRELEATPMPDPLEEIEHRLGMSTSPPSPQIWAG